MSTRVQYTVYGQSVRNHCVNKSTVYSVWTVSKEPLCQQEHSIQYRVGRKEVALTKQVSIKHQMEAIQYMHAHTVTHVGGLTTTI